MKKYLLLVLVYFFLCSNVYGASLVPDQGSLINNDTSTFDGALSGSDTDAQTAFETLDNKTPTSTGTTGQVPISDGTNIIPRTLSGDVSIDSAGTVIVSGAAAGFDVTGDVTITGKLKSDNEQFNKQMAQSIKAILGNDCQFLMYPSNPGDTNTEVNRCGLSNTVTYESITSSQRGVVGQVWYLDFDGVDDEINIADRGTIGTTSDSEDTTNELLTLTAHGFSNYDQISFATACAGVGTTTVYTVCTCDATTSVGCTTANEFHVATSTDNCDSQTFVNITTEACTSAVYDYNFRFDDANGNDVSFSIGFYINIPVDNVTDDIISMIASSNSMWRVQIINGDIRVRMLDNSSGEFTNLQSTSLTVDTWYSVVFVYDASGSAGPTNQAFDSKIYINGVTAIQAPAANGSYTVSMERKSSNLVIGNTDGGTKWFIGKLAFPWIAKRALKKYEIEQIDLHRGRLCE